MLMILAGCGIVFLVIWLIMFLTDYNGGSPLDSAITSLKVTSVVAVICAAILAASVLIAAGIKSLSSTP